MVRGKFTVVEVAQVSWSQMARKIVLQPEYDSSIPEDQKYAQATPSGRIEMTVDNPSAAEQLAIGKKFYVDFNPVEEPVPA